MQSPLFSVVVSIPGDYCFYEVQVCDGTITSIRYYPDSASSRNWTVSFDGLPEKHQTRIINKINEALE